MTQKRLYERLTHTTKTAASYSSSLCVEAPFPPQPPLFRTTRTRQWRQSLRPFFRPASVVVDELCDFISGADIAFVMVDIANAKHF